MKNYTVNITSEERNTILWVLSEWMELSREAIKAKIADENSEAVKELEEEMNSIERALKKIQNANVE